MSEEEQIFPRRPDLNWAAKRLKQISEKDYTTRLADVMKRYEESTSELTTVPSPEIVHMPLTVQRVEPQTTTLHILDDEKLRALVREEVHRAIYPTAEMADPHEHRRIEMTEENGKRWRGVLYAVEQDEE